MTTIPGYHQNTRLHRGQRHAVWRGWRRWDELPVIIKSLVKRFPTATETNRLRRENDILVRLAGVGAPRPLSLEITDESAAIIMVDEGGKTFEDLIRRGPLPVDRFLDVAVAATRALAAVHGKGIIHRDISPSNILLLANGTACLIDFATAIDATTAATAEPSSMAEGNPVYMPPEQTGRINRQVDHRSDLYALGGTFQVLLTGRPPFTGGDNLDLIHAHLSRPPQAVHSLNPRVPETLSRIIHKLLAKAQEDRYQSLDGLISDLTTCKTMLANGQTIPDDLPLATEDLSDHFRLPQKIYGRRIEMAALSAAFERTAIDRIELALVSGPSGIGKSALVREVFRPLNGSRATVISGKFEEFRRNVPYGAIVDAFSQFIRLQLTGPESDITGLRIRLERALQGNGGVLAEALPDLELLLGPQAPPPPLPPLETENRFSRLFRAFLGTMLGPDRPLVLVLDDLQWADRASLNLLQTVLMTDDLRHMFIVGTARNDEIDAGHPLTFLIERLRGTKLPMTQLVLDPLDEDTVTTLIAETLSCPAAEAAPLARLCLEKTSGNAFFLSRFLESLHESGYIAFNRTARRWIWQVEDISSLDITDNVVDLMLEKIRRLSPVGQRVLQRAACIGSRFDLLTLSRINDVPPSATLDQLWEAIREGLVIPGNDAWRHFRRSAHPAKDGKKAQNSAPHPAAAVAREVEFRFLHDRVFQAAYSLIPEDDRGLRHLNVGRSLLASVDEENLGERLFEIVNQLNLGSHLVSDPDLAERIALLNLEAARKAAATAGYSSALGYARAGRTSLGPSAWSTASGLTFDLTAEAAQAAHMIGDRTTTDTLCEDILENSTDLLERSRAQELIILGLVQNNSISTAIDTAVDALKALGFSLPARPGKIRTRISALQFDHLVRRASRIDLARKPRPFRYDAGLARQALRLLAIILAATHASRPNLGVLISTLHMDLALSLQDSGHIAFTYGIHAVMCSAAGNPGKALTSATLALDEARRKPPTAITARTMLFVAFNAGHWRTPLRSLRVMAEEAQAISLDNGDLNTASHATMAKTMAGFLAGIDLSELRQDITVALKTHDDKKGDWTRFAITAVEQAIANLGAPGPTPWILSGHHHNEDTARRMLHQGGGEVILVMTLLVRMTVAALFGQWQVVRDTTAEIGRHSPNYSTALGQLTFEMLGVLAWTRDPDAGPLAKRMAVLRQGLERFREWTAIGPANSLHRKQILEAESARLSGDPLRASELYDQAIKTAHETGFLHEQALFNEMAADFHQSRERPMIADVYRRQAYYRYSLWGARAKLVSMEDTYPDLSGGFDALSSASHRAEPFGIDLTAVMKAAQAISGEIHRPALVRKLLSITMGAAGAQRGVLFLSNDDSWTIEAEADDSTGLVSLLSSPLPDDDAMPPARQSPPLPAFSRGVFNYCIRTREPVVLHNAPDDGGFMTDPYVMAQRPRSILCLPLLQQSDIKGALYLENNLTTGAFTAERLEILRFLSAQVVISLENAILYDDLSGLNRTLEKEVFKRSREAVENFQLLEASLDNMSDGLMAFDPEGRLLVWNDRVVELLRLPAHLCQSGTPQGDLIAAILASGMLAPEAHAMVEARHAEGADAFPDTPSFLVDLADGRFLQIRRTFMPDGGQVQVYLDVTAERLREQELEAAREAAVGALEDLKETQESLIQAEKMASLGQLVAGIAHEINTPVGITLTAASLLSEKATALARALRDDSLRKSQLEQFVAQTTETTSLMMSNIQRAADLIHGFKQVAVDQTSGDHRQFSLGDYIGEVVRSFGPMLRRSAHQIEVECPEDLEVDSYPGALSQILTNLTVNALTHAFPDDTAGKITIKVSPVGHSDIELRFSDNGQGIPVGLQPKVFDPFFTTRRGSGGSGLGLNIAYNLVSGVLHGTIGLESTPGEGTTFILRFPRQAEIASSP